jgi:hypothetical protein
MFPAMLQSRFWVTSSPLYRATLLEAAGPWLPLRMEEDWEYDARVAAQGVRLCHVAEVLSETRTVVVGGLSGQLNAPTLRDRATAHESIFRSARRAGIGEDTPEMRHFARELFLLARQCGAAGLPAESERLFSIARDASGADAHRMQFRLYGALARVAGWTAAGRLASLTDRLRRRETGD